MRSQKSSSRHHQEFMRSAAAAAVEASRRPRKELLFEQKREICEYRRRNPGQKQEHLRQFFSQKYGRELSRSTFNDILRDAGRILSFQPVNSHQVVRMRPAYKLNNNNNATSTSNVVVVVASSSTATSASSQPQQMSASRDDDDDVDEALWNWYCQQLEDDENNMIALDDEVLVEQARFYGLALTSEADEAAWLRGFKLRHNINAADFINNNDNNTTSYDCESGMVNEGNNWVVFLLLLYYQLFENNAFYLYLF